MAGTGHIEDIPDDRDHPVQLTPEDMKAAKVDASFTVFDTGDSKPAYKKSILHQHSIGTCTCNAVASAYMYELQRQKVVFTPSTYTPSCLFLYYVARYARLYDKSISASDIPTVQYYADLAKVVPPGLPPSAQLLEDSGSQARDVIKS